MVLQTAKPASFPERNSDSSTDVTARRHLLTVNVEDYFQVGVFQKFIGVDKWYRFESRLQQNVERILELLDQHRTQATFFVLGWTAEQQPELVRAIADAGHEIASRGFLHQSLHTLPKDRIREDLLRARAVLEDVTGQPVDGFRLSDGWLDKSTLWLLDEVVAAGYRYDSSLMPKQRDFADEPKWRNIQNIQTANGPVLEIPLSTIPLPGGWLPIAGGNYQRQVPDFLMRRLVDRAVESDAEPFVMYFQVWELDADQPRLSVADRMTRFRHYRKLGKYGRILPQYLERYSFTSVRSHAQQMKSPLHRLAESPPVASRSVRRHQIDSASIQELASAGKVPPKRQFSSHLSPTDEACLATDRTPITIVIPCYNEEVTLRYLANTLNSVYAKLVQKYSPTILFVDDCSSDNTFDVLHQQFGHDPAVEIIRHETNQGVSAAILTGLRAARTEIVCSMDCDCSYDPHELARMLPRLTDDVSMVTGSPYHKDGLVRNVPAWRLVLSRGLSWIYQRLLKEELATWTSCFRVYRRSHILDLPLKENGFLGTAELAAQLVLNHRRIAEHPATLEVRLFGLSKMKTIRAIMSHLKLLSRIAASRFFKTKA
ncbi:MAG: glycosyltransferase [Planctomycetaceae bacterium]